MRLPVVAVSLALVAAAAIACGTSSETPSVFSGASPIASDAEIRDPAPNLGDGGPGDAAMLPDIAIGALEVVIRDFRKYDADAGADKVNPDFENVPTNDERPDGAAPPYAGPWTEASADYFAGATYAIDIVQADLGSDDKPQYNTSASFRGTAGRTATTHGKAFFDQWYHDTPGMNVTRKIPIKLERNDAGVYSYDSAVSGVPLSAAKPSKNFFPIDDGTPSATTDDGFGNQGNAHNYHFTVEIHTKFKYRGDETFAFSGDDDVFVFINKKLAINIGGIHAALTKTVDLPAVADKLGLVVGHEYSLDFFQAERHRSGSNLRIDTTLDLQPLVVH